MWFLLPFVTVGDFSTLTEDEMGLVAVLVCCGVYLILSSLLFYYFSYRRRGTWLLFGVLIAPLTFLQKLVDPKTAELAVQFVPLISFFKGGSWGEKSYDVVASCAWCYWYVMCFKLLKINKIAKQMSGITDGLKQEIMKLQQSETVDELESVLYQAVKKWPQREKVLSHAFKVRKAKLLPDG